MGLLCSGHLKRVLRPGAVWGLVSLSGTTMAWGQDATITGAVTSAAGPLLGASVSVGGRFTAVTGPSGRYTLTIPASFLSTKTGNLTARMIGHRPVTREIRLVPGSQQQDFMLETDPLHLEELVVTGVSDSMSTLKLPFSVGVVSGEELQQVPGVTALEALAGRVAGVSVMQSTGIPGAAPAIRIRGYTSIYTTPQPPLLILDGTITRMTLSDISSEDIERVEVLKGAAATSYYGSDAANGVIQVFTRRGTSLADGKLLATARFEAGTGFITGRPPTSLHHFYQLDSAGQFLRAPDGTRIAEDDLIQDNPYPVYYDQVSQVFRNAGFYTASLSVSQRKGNTSFAASFQQTSNEGVIELTGGFQRQNYRINLDQGLGQRVDLSLNFFYGRSRSDGQENAGAKVSWDLLYLEPHMDITQPNADGTPYNNQLVDASNIGTYNPLYDLANIRSTNDRDRFTGGGRLRWRTTNWLTLEGQYHFDSEGSRRFDTAKHGYINPNGDLLDGWLTRSSLMGQNYNVGLTATGTWSWRTVRNTTRMAFIYEDQSRVEQAADGGRTFVGGVTSFAAEDPSTTTAASAEYAIKTQDYFAVTTFDIRDRYILDALVRRDGSSLFGEASRYAPYFRVSGAWRVTEDFRIPGLDELRVRASYGTAGLRPGFDYQYELLAKQGNTFVKQSLGNTLLKPAHSGEFEVGTNLTFGHSRYSLEYNYSHKETQDQMVQRNLPAVSGFETQWVNAGTLVTKTHELALGIQAVQRRDLGLTLNLTGDRMRSVITEWPLPDQRTFWGWNRAGQDLGRVNGWRFAHTVDELYDDPAKKAESGPGQYWSPDSVMVNEMGHVVRRSGWRTVAEKPIIYTTCANPPECTQSTNSVLLGRTDPDFTVSLTGTVTWKRLALTALVYWWQGGNIYNGDRWNAFRGQRDVMLDQSSKPLEERKPATYFGEYGTADEPILEPATFVKIRELNVNYTFVRRQLQAVGLGMLNELRLGIAGRNLFTFTRFSGWDPEVGGGQTWDGGLRTSTEDPYRVRMQSSTYPLARTVTAIVEIAF